jgi:DNA-binding LacI/PurR family transcriptional regulator
LVSSSVRLAASHLLEQGYQKIGIISGPQAWWEARERESGWRDVLHKAGQAELDRYQERGDWTAASGNKAMIRLLEREPDLEAVFVANDSMALGALQAVAGYGRSVPHDLAIIGFDDIPESAYFSPPLTTVRQDLLEVGCRAVSLLHHQLLARRNDETPMAEVSIVEPQLVIRKSSIKESS